MIGRKQVLEWNLMVAMGRKQIRKASDLRRKLADVGYEISAAQLCRLLKQRPKHISWDLLEGLMLVLDCRVGDLLCMPDENQTKGEPQGSDNTRPQVKEISSARTPKGKSGSPVDQRSEGSGIVLGPRALLVPVVGALPGGKKGSI